MKSNKVRFLALLMTTMIVYQSFGMQVYAADIQEVTENTTQTTEEVSADTTETSETPTSEEPATTEEPASTDEPSNTGDSGEVEPEEENEEELNEIEVIEEEEEDIVEATENPFEITTSGVLTNYNKPNNFDGKIIIPEGVESIENGAFDSVKTEVTEIVFPESLTSLTASAFAGYSALSKIEFKSTSSLNVKGTAFSGCALTDITLAEGIKTIPNNFMSNATFGSNATIHIPASVTKIGISAFENYGAANSIAVLDFASGSKLKSISTDAFNSCYSLTSITLPASLTTIGAYAFYGCKNLSSVTFEDGSLMATIGREAFRGCSSLTAITIPSNMITLDEYAFGDCTSLTDLTVQSTKLTTVRNYIFANCKLTNVTLPEGMTTVPRIFYHAKFAPGTTVTIPSTATSISEYAFNSTNIAGIQFAGNSVTSIGQYAFEDCSSLADITLPSTLKTIGTAAFKNCSSISSVIIPSEMTAIGREVFNGCSGITSLSIGPKVTSIGAYAFYGCRGLKELTIPDNVTSISAYAFTRCTGLETLSVSANVKSLPYRSFGYCTKLSDLYLGNGITSVIDKDGYAFEGTEQATLNIYVGSSSSSTYAALKKAVSKNLLSLGQIVLTSKITYKLNGGNATGTYATNYLEEEDSSSTIKLSHPSRAGYVFAGWYLDAKYTKSIGRAYTNYCTIPVSGLKGNVTLYAKWVGPTFYTVDLDAGSGSVSTSSITVAKDATYGEHDSITNFGLPKATPVDGYTFIGWYTSDDELVTASTKVTNEANGQTLKAKYKSKKTTVATPEINVVGVGKIETDSTVVEGSKIYFSCDTDEAVINYEIKDSSNNTYASGEYSSNVVMDDPGVYTVTATATCDGVTSAQASASITITESAESVLYSASKKGKLWIEYNGADYDAENVNVPYTGAAVKLSGYTVYYGKAMLSEGSDYTVSYKNNTKSASYNETNAKGTSVAPTIVITGKGSITGTLVETFNIVAPETNAVKLTNSNTIVDITSTADDLIYDGTAKAPQFTVKYKKAKNDIVDVSASDYVATYSNNIKAGKGTITITFKSGVGYYGVLTKQFVISQVDISKYATTDTSGKVQINKLDSVVYDKADISGLQSLVLLSTGDQLVEKTDFTKSISRKNSVATMKITGKGNFKGSVSFTYTIENANITNNADITVQKLFAPVYTGKAGVYKPVAYTVYDGTTAMKLNTDYTVSFEINGEAPNAKTVYAAGTTVSLIIKGKGNYTGEKTVNYNIANTYDFADSNVVDVTVANVTYANKAGICNPKITVKNLYTGKTLGNGAKKDFVVDSYKYAEETVVTRIVNKKTTHVIVSAGDEVTKQDIIPAGTRINVTLKGVNSYDGTVTKTFRFIYNMTKADVKVTNQTYTGSAIVPAKSDITIKVAGQTLSSKDYEIVSCTNNLRAGTAKITIKGNGAFVGTKTVTFKIVKKKL